MVVKGFHLAAAFEQFIAGHRGQRVEWLPKDDLDAYGNDWHGPMEFFANPEEMAYWSERLAELLGGETEVQVAERERLRQKLLDKLPGSIPWITDFSHIVEIGLDYSGAHYCFDFRSDPGNPSVICYDHGSWRRVAPDFDTVISILERYDGQDLEEREREILERRSPDGAEAALPSTINGLALPAAFQAFLRRYPDRIWRLKAISNVGESQEWQFVPYDTLQLILSGTGYAAATGKGISDHSQILAFGVSPGRSPFAFDYRENLQEPSVICMTGPDKHWRRIAPNFETFLHLLEGYDFDTHVDILEPNDGSVDLDD